jgi:hypothetical protein
LEKEVGNETLDKFEKATFLAMEIHCDISIIILWKIQNEKHLHGNMPLTQGNNLLSATLCYDRK